MFQPATPTAAFTCRHNTYCSTCQLPWCLRQGTRGLNVPHTSAPASLQLQRPEFDYEGQPTEVVDNGEISRTPHLIALQRCSKSRFTLLTAPRLANYLLDCNSNSTDFSDVDCKVNDCSPNLTQIDGALGASSSVTRRSHREPSAMGDLQ